LVKPLGGSALVSYRFFSYWPMALFSSRLPEVVFRGFLYASYVVSFWHGTSVVLSHS